MIRLNRADKLREFTKPMTACSASVPVFRTSGTTDFLPMCLCSISGVASFLRVSASVLLTPSARRNVRTQNLSQLLVCSCRQPFNISDLVDCEVLLCDHSDMVQVDRISGCKVLIGACCESVFLRNCKDCTITVAWYVGNTRLKSDRNANLAWHSCGDSYCILRPNNAGLLCPSFSNAHWSRMCV